MDAKTRIAHVPGPRATILNTPPLVTSNKVRPRRGLAKRLAFDAVRPEAG